MAVTGYPFDDQDTTESQYGTLMAALHDEGVVGVGDGLLVESGSSGVTVRPGVCISKGFVVVVDATETVAASAGEWVIARVDTTTNSASVGGVSAPFTGSDVWDIPLAQVTSSGVVDRRPWVGTQVGRWATVDRPAGTPPRIGWNTGLQRWESITPAGAAPLTLTVKIFDHAPTAGELADGELGLEVI
jgi:hypothetical protein